MSSNYSDKRCSLSVKSYYLPRSAEEIRVTERMKDIHTVSPVFDKFKAVGTFFYNTFILFILINRLLYVVCIIFESVSTGVFK